MANLWKQGVQENKDFWKKGSSSDKLGTVTGALGAAGSIVGNSFSLAKGNKAALDNVKQQAIATNQQMVGSDSLDSIYNTALSYNPMSTDHKWQEFFANGGYLNNPKYLYFDDYDYYPNRYGTGGKILSSGLSNVSSGAAAGMKIGGPWGAAIGGAVGLIGTALGGIFGHSKAKKMARQANAYAQEANDGMQYKINSAIDDNAYKTLQGYENALPYAYGGLLGDDMGAIGYSLANDYLTIKDKQATNKQTPLSYLGNSYIKQKPVTVFNDNNSFSEGGGINIAKSHEGLFTQQAKKNGMSVQEFANHVLANKDKYPTSTVRRANFARNASGWNNEKAKRYALGGDVQTNGSDFTDGLTEVNAGGTHEENPNGGVPMGVAPDNNPNLVEEGETIYDDYVFSNRIKPDDETLSKFHMPKSSSMTYAGLSKKLEKESKERPNDPISQDGLSAMLGKLAQEQERQKAEEEEKKAEEAFAALSPEEKQIVMQEMANRQEQQAQVEQQTEQQPQEEQMNAAPEEQGTQLSPEQQEAMQQQAMANEQNVPQEGYAEGGEIHKFAKGGKKHIGTWKKGWDETKAWNTYAKSALERMLSDATAEINSAKTPEEKLKIQQKFVNKFNAIQRSYADAYQSTKEKAKKPKKPKDDMLPTWYRKVGMFGPLVGLGMQALGIGRNPGEDAYNAGLSAINSTGNPYPSHIGNYMRYTPFDLWSGLYNEGNKSLATARGITNNNESAGSKMSGLIANSNNYYQGIGNLIRQAQEYNMKNMSDVATFNRGTDQFNAQADNQFALAANQNNQWKAQALMNYAAQKAAQDKQWYDDLYGNVNDFFTNISNYGRENVSINQTNKVAGTMGGVGKSDANTHMGGFRQTAAKGGKLNKKKRRGSLLSTKIF